MTMWESSSSNNNNNEPVTPFKRHADIGTAMSIDECSCCPTKRETDALGGVKIQIAGKPNEYGYQRIQDLDGIPKELKPIFFHDAPDDDYANGCAMNLWTDFWKDVISMQQRSTQVTHSLLNGGVMLSTIVACFGFFVRSIWLTLGCLVVSILVLIFCYQTAVVAADCEDTYIDDLCDLLDAKYNKSYFRPRGWVARCHTELSNPEPEHGPETFHIIHFVPINVSTYEAIKEKEDNYQEGQFVLV